MRNADRERGATLITVALMIALLITILALAVDLGIGYVERRRVQSVADAAALAGVQVLVNNLSDATIISTVQQYVQTRNPLDAGEARAFRIYWMQGTTVLSQEVGNGARPQGVTGILVRVRGTTPTFFANILGVTEVTAQADGGGGYSPLEAMLVMDRSRSMEFYSCNFERYYASGQVCKSLIDASYPTEYDRIYDVYYSCRNDTRPNYCGGVWATATPRAGTSTPTPKAKTPTATPAAMCVWGNTKKPMTPVPTECATPGVKTKTNCENCKAAIVTPYKPMEPAKSAAAYFVSLVQAELFRTEPRMGLVTYWGSVSGQPDATLNVPLTFNLATVSSGIQGLGRPDGNTNCELGLYTARVELTSRGRATAVKAIIFLTDGQANLYRGCSSGCNQATARQKAIDEAHTAQNNGIRVYTIGLGSGADQAMLQEMVVDADGDYDGAYVYADSGADLAAAYAELFAKIKQLRLVQ